MESIFSTCTTSPSHLSETTVSQMSLPAHYYLVVDVFILMLQFASALSNGFILILFAKCRRLQTRMSLKIIHMLAFTDFLFAIIALPYTLYYTVHWQPELFDYDPTFVVISSLPLTLQFKMNLVIAIAIAVDRLQALRMPMYYRVKPHGVFVFLTITIGLVLGLVDCVIEVTSTDFRTRRFNCAAVGCFQSALFRTYWGTSNTVLNAMALLLTFWVAYELQMSTARKMPQSLGGIRDQKQLSQANRLFFGVLVISVIFLMVPSSVVSFAEFTAVNMFRVLGPFYIVGLLCAGTANGIVYVLLHVELRRAALELLRKKVSHVGVTSPVLLGGTQKTHSSTANV